MPQRVRAASVASLQPHPEHQGFTLRSLELPASSCPTTSGGPGLAQLGVISPPGRLPPKASVKGWVFPQIGRVQPWKSLARRRQGQLQHYKAAGPLRTCPQGRPLQTEAGQTAHCGQAGKERRHLVDRGIYSLSGTPYPPDLTTDPPEGHRGPFSHLGERCLVTVTLSQCTGPYPQRSS